MLDENDTTTPTTEPGTDAAADQAAVSHPSAVDAPTEVPGTGSPAPSPDADSPAADSPAADSPAADSPAADSPAADSPAAEAAPVAKRAARKRTAGKTTTKRAAKKTAVDPATLPVENEAEAPPPEYPSVPVEAPAKRTTRKVAAKRVTAKRAPTKRTTKKATAPGSDAPGSDSPVPDLSDADHASPVSDAALADAMLTDDAMPADTEPADVSTPEQEQRTSVSSAPSLLFRAPDPLSAPPRRRGSAGPGAAESEAGAGTTSADATVVEDAGAEADTEPDIALDAGPDAGPDTEPDTGPDTGPDAGSDTGVEDEQSVNRRRRRRGGRRRRRSGGAEDSSEGPEDVSEDVEQPTASEDSQGDEADEDAGQDAAQSGGRGSGRRGSGQRGQQTRRGSGQSGSGAKDPGQSESGQKDAGQKDAGQKDAGQKDAGQKEAGPDSAEEQVEADGEEGTGSRRRRRRRRTGEEGDAGEDQQSTVTRVRKSRNAEDEITALHGSTRLEAKKQRRREGREAGRRRAPIVSEAEFLARREAVDRVMVIRQRADLTQIAVLEDKVLVEHYVARESQTSLIGNVYLGRVQNVLPSMEAAFIDIGKGRNAVLYAGEVNWDSLGAGNGPRKIESVLKSGQPILVQVSKDPIGHKGARLTSQISLPGRFLVYVPDGTTSGISRKLPDTERNRLKTLLKTIVPDSAGVIVRTAAEGASEEELTLDVERLTARWADIESKVAKGNAPQLLYGEPDLTLKVVRDLFTEDFAKLVVSGDEAWEMVDSYVKHVAPDLEDRLERYTDEGDVFAAYRIDEQIAKGLDRKVWLPSGGSLIIDRTEAMTVVDVNTGKFTGSGGNLEETVTKNNLEAAEEMIRQLRLRDIGGIIVVDFIDMVLESNRDLVLRRLVECLGRDRTRHQVAEVTSLGLVQMTRKRIGTGLLEAFSETCEHCQGRGLLVHHEPVEPSRRTLDEEPRRGRRGRGRGSEDGDAAVTTISRPSPSPKDIAAIAKHDHRPAGEMPAQRGEGEAGPTDGSAPATTPDGAVPVPGASTAPVAPLVDGSSVPLDPAAETLERDQVPSGPVVVTTSRRRVARRPAGSAAPVTPEPVTPEPVTPEPVTPEPVTPEPVTPEPVTPEPVTPEPVTPDPMAPEPVTPNPVAPEPVTSDPVAPEPVTTPQPVSAPVLVTSTRRRVARRPAGPPAGSLQTQPAQTQDGLLEPSPVQASADGHRDRVPEGGAPDEEVHPESVHVPVKKKGSRKR